jgi:hypothetical protein
MTTRKLRLGPLPKTESTKLTFACPASLKADLDRYATLHAQTYGEAVDATVLIPHMLEAFMVGDRGFRKEARARPRRRSQADDAGFRWRPSSNAQPKAARSSFWRTATDWAMKTKRGYRLQATAPMQHARAFYREAPMWLPAHNATAPQGGPK